MGWIGVDLDGTLALYEPGDFSKKGMLTIGEPVPLMAQRVREWLQSGKDVRIFTARVSSKNSTYVAEITHAIQNWTFQQFGVRLIVTCVKDGYCDAIYDDRAFQVIRNTGKIVGIDA